GNEERPCEGQDGTCGTPPRRWPAPRVAGVTAIAASGVATIEVAAAIGLDQVQSLMGNVGLGGAEAGDAVVDVPDQETFSRQAPVGADPRAVLEQVVLLGVTGDRRDAEHAGRSLDRRQRDADRGRLDRLDVHPAELELRPRRELRRVLALTEPRALSHEVPHADPLLGMITWRVELGQAEQVTELVTEHAERSERRDLVLGDHARVLENMRLG